MLKNNMVVGVERVETMFILQSSTKRNLTSDVKVWFKNVYAVIVCGVYHLKTKHSNYCFKLKKFIIKRSTTDSPW